MSIELENVKKIVTNLLLIFTLISFGFMLGKNSVKPRNNSNNLDVNNSESYIAVYYMHSTFRCVTCNTIEKMSKEIIDKTYASKLKSGKIKWQEVDFQENSQMAKKFEVISSCLVVANIQKGFMVDYKRLDEVWELMRKPAEFNNYVSTAINFYLSKMEDN